MNKQHSYIKEMPEGYKYCSECELLTPHTLDSRVNPSKSMSCDFICDVCGNTPDGYEDCPNCGWSHDPDRDVKPLTIKIKKHTTVCLENQRKNWELETLNPDAFDFIIDDDNCNCPEVTAYPIQNIFNYRSSPAHWNMECSNAIEWSYEIMCPICNYVFEVDDGNC